jgi:hypothetical protein
MSHEPKIRIIGAKKASSELTIESLVNFAERVIRTDKEAALKAQNSASDLAKPSNDRPLAERQTPRISTLNELSHRSGSVKIKTDDRDQDSSEKLIKFSRKAE